MAQKVTAYMPADAFKLRPEVDKTKLYDPIQLTLQRAESLAVLLQDNGACMTDGFTVSHSHVLHTLEMIEQSIKQATELLKSAHQAGGIH